MERAFEKSTSIRLASSPPSSQPIGNPSNHETLAKSNRWKHRRGPETIQKGPGYES